MMAQLIWIILKKSLSENMISKLFVSVMAVNNETGIIQPIEKIAALCLKYNSIFHVDAVQAIGRIKISMSKMNIDLLTVSSHKIGGPKGIGCLAVNKTVYNNLSPIIYGEDKREELGLVQKLCLKLQVLELLLNIQENLIY